MKRILVLAPRFPYPLNGGDKIRIYGVAKGLADSGHELSLLSFVADRNEAAMAGRPEIESVFRNVETVELPKWKSYLNTLVGLLGKEPLQTHYYRSRKMAEAVARELGTGRYDGVLVHLARMAPYVMGRREVRKVLEMTDALSLNYERSRAYGSRGFLGVVYRIEEKRIAKFEKECIKDFDQVVVVSSVDKNHLARGLSAKEAEKVTVVPRHAVIGIPREQDLDACDPNLMVFTGNLKTHQNNDALLYFIKKIYPLIRSRRSAAVFRVIGRSPSREVRAYGAKEGIEVTGWVESLEDYEKDACVSVCPMRIGAGVNGKVLEAMAMGIPVVTTSVGAEGIEGAVSGTHFMVADSPDTFADAVLSLMENADLRKNIGREGRALMLGRYRLEDVGKAYEAVI